MRNIVSAYVDGAGKIVLKGNEVSTVAEEARRVLSEVEITEENGDELILRILAFEDLDIDGIIKREYNVTNSMFGVVINRYQEDIDVKTEISRKEDDVDRLYLLLLRNVCLGAGKSREVVFKTMAAKSIEKISDHLEDICLSANEDVAPNESIVQVLQIAQQMYNLAYGTFTNGETDNLEYTNAKKKYNNLSKAVDEKIKKDKNQSKILAIKTVMEKCAKLIRYAEDIIESSSDLAFAKDS
jgi:phosphate uptake regulator